jgi:hypothetical protein
MSHLYVSGYAARFGNRRRVINFDGPSAPRPDLEVEPHVDSERLEQILRCSRRHTRRHVGRLADSLNLPAQYLDDLEVGYLDGRWVFPERNDRFQLVGIVYRSPDGSKVCEPGSVRGLVLARSGSIRPDIVYVAEGATDTAALHSVGMAAIGRPAAHASAAVRLWLSRRLRLLGNPEVVVVGDRDADRQGKATGRDGARALAEFLSEVLGYSVPFALPAERFKDAREQIVAGRWSQGLSIVEKQ